MYYAQKLVYARTRAQWITYIGEQDLEQLTGSSKRVVRFDWVSIIVFGLSTFKYADDAWDVGHAMDEI